MRKVRSPDTAGSWHSEDSDLSSQLSNLRSEVFDYENNKKNGKLIENLHEKDKKIHYASRSTPNKLSMDDILSPMVPKTRHNPRESLFRHTTTTLKDSTMMSRAVLETEQMGLRLTDEIQRLRGELKRYRETNSELSSTNAKLNSELEIYKGRQLETTQTIQNLTASNTKLTQECERLKLELSTHSERNSLIDERYQLIQDKLKVLITEKEVLKEKYDGIVLENERLKEKNDSLEVKYQKLLKSVDSERSTQHSYQKSLQETEEQLLRLTRSLDESKADCLLMRKQIAEGGEGRNGLMLILQERELEIQRLNATNRELTDRIEDHQSNLKTLKYRLELIERENENSHEEIQKYRQKKVKIEQERCALERQLHAVEEQRTYLMNEKSKLEEDLEEAKRRASLLQDSLNRIESSNNSLSSSHGQKLQAIRHQLQSTTQMLEQIQLQRLQQEDTIRDLRSQYAALEEKYAILKRLNRQLLTATDTYESILQRRDMEKEISS